MPRAGFEPTMPMFERLKTVRSLDCAAIGTGHFLLSALERLLQEGTLSN